MARPGANASQVASAGMRCLRMYQTAATAAPISPPENTPPACSVLTAENVAGMGRVVAPVVDDVENLGADDAAQDDQNSQVPCVVRIDPLLAGVADADPQAEQHSGGNQQSVGGKEELADMKKLRKHC